MIEAKIPPRMEAPLSTEPKEIYKHFEALYYSYLEQESDWNAYRNNSKANRYNRNYYPEKLAAQFKALIDKEIFDEYPFFKQYNENYPEYEDFKKRNNYSEEKLTSSEEAETMTVRLFNITEEELYYPNIKVLYSTHSADHSIAMVLNQIEKGTFKGHEAILYCETLLTHTLDKEFVSYFAEKVKLPLIIIKKDENLSYSLESNGLPKIGQFGRWCTKTYKIKPTAWFIRKYFFPILDQIKNPHIYNKKDLIALCKEHTNRNPPKEIAKSRGKLVRYIATMIRKEIIKHKVKSKRQLQDVRFQTSKWNSETKAWEQSTDRKTIPIYKKESKDSYQQTNGLIRPHNVIEFLGLTKQQSTNRGLVNPNVRIADKSDIKQLTFYQHSPIFHWKFKKIEEIIKKSGLIRNPYIAFYEDLYNKPDQDTPKIETRFGCLLCPHKKVRYYIYLYNNYPLRFYLAKFYRLLGSARSIIRDKVEYYYYIDTKTSRPNKKKIYNTLYPSARTILHAPLVSEISKFLLELVICETTNYDPEIRRELFPFLRPEFYALLKNLHNLLFSPFNKLTD